MFINILISASLSGQYVKPCLLASGGLFASGTKISISYSIGEQAIKTIKTKSNIFTEGFQQTFPDKKFRGSKNKILVYPNPVEDILTISFEIEETKSYVVTIFSLTGQTLSIKKYDDLAYTKNMKYDFSNRARGLYLIKIQSTDGQFFRTFKIEKL
jgi:hypothetical protein